MIEPVISFGFAGLADHPVLQRAFRDRAAVDRRILDALGDGPYILGQKFSGADILIASMGQFLRAMLPAGDLVDAYLARCNGRPAVARALARDNG